MNMHSEPAPGAAEHDAGIKLTVWVHYATEHEHARDRAERADTERKMLFDLAVDDLLAQARVRGEKLPIANAERAVAISPEYRKAIDAAHRLRLEAGIARIAERKAHHEHEAAVRHTHSERQERRMHGR